MGATGIPMGVTGPAPQDSGVFPEGSKENPKKIDLTPEMISEIKQNLLNEKLDLNDPETLPLLMAVFYSEKLNDSKTVESLPQHLGRCIIESEPQITSILEKAEGYGPKVDASYEEIYSNLGTTEGRSYITGRSSGKVAVWTLGDVELNFDRFSKLHYLHVRRYLGGYEADTSFQPDEVRRAETEISLDRETGYSFESDRIPFMVKTFDGVTKNEDGEQTNYREENVKTMYYSVNVQRE